MRNLYASRLLVGKWTTLPDGGPLPAGPDKGENSGPSGATEEQEKVAAVKKMDDCILEQINFLTGRASMTRGFDTETVFSNGILSAKQSNKETISEVFAEEMERAEAYGRTIKRMLIEPPSIGRRKYKLI